MGNVDLLVEQLEDGKTHGHEDSVVKQGVNLYHKSIDIYLLGKQIINNEVRATIEQRF